MRAILTGTGNLDRLIPPEIPSNESWDVLPATERRRHAEEQRFFVYTLVPRLPGKLLTPALRFSTFDPLTKQFSRIEFKPIEVTVTGNAPAQVDLVTADPAAPAGAKPKAASGLAAPAPQRGSALFRGMPSLSLASSAAFWSGNGLLLLVLLTLTGGVLYVGYLAAHPEIRRRRRARSLVRAALVDATAARRRGDRSAFALAAVRALQAGAAALLDAEEAAMTQGDLERVLPGAPRALLDALFGQAYGGRFAEGAGVGGSLGEDETLELLRRLLSLL